MSGFSADWLTLREPYDSRARNAKVLTAVAASFEKHDTIQIVDLGCGTGSTIRALSPLLAARQKWRLVDNDTELLAKAMATRPLERVAATAVALDLNRDFEAALDGPINLVTTSALLDLVSEAWLERLAMQVATRSIPFYAALNYDGRIELTSSRSVRYCYCRRGQCTSTHREEFRARARSRSSGLCHHPLPIAQLCLSARTIRLGHQFGRWQNAIGSSCRMGESCSGYGRTDRG